MIRPYVESDYEDVMSWLDKRNMKRVHPDVLSDIGFIIPGVCAVWVYITNSDFCYIENLFSNPDVKNKFQHISFLLDTAKEAAIKLDYKFILSVTDNSSVIKHALMFGAEVESGKSLITLQIK